MIFLPREARAALSWSLWQCDYISSAAQEPQIHLYAADVPINLATTLADLVAAEATFGDYFPGPLGRPSDLGFTDAGNDLVSWPETLWKVGPSGTPCDCYGYWVDLLTYRLTRSLAWVERFPAPIAMRSEGSYLAITPQFAIGQLQPDPLAARLHGGGIVLGGGNGA